MPASINNYQVGKGVLYFSDDGSTWTDVGNAPDFEFEPTSETLPHYSSREGVKKKDAEFTISQSGTLKVTLEEITPENLTIFLLGETATITLDSWAVTTAYAVGDRVTNASNAYECITAGTSAASGGPTGTNSDITDGTVHWKYLSAGATKTQIDIMASTSVSKHVKMVGTNDIGKKFEWIFPSVRFKPAGGFKAIGDDYTVIELEGEVLASGNSFGTVTEL